jgi:hypothetical protein
MLWSICSISIATPEASMAAANLGRKESRGDNEGTLSRLRCRKNRVHKWFLAFLVLMPVGCVGPFTLFSFAPKGAQTPLFIAALVLPLVGLAGALLMGGDRSRYKRAVAIAELGDRLRLRYVEKPDASDSARLQTLKMFSNTDGEAGTMHLLAGKVETVPVTIIDYGFVIGFGSNKAVYQQTVFLLDDVAGVSAVGGRPRRGGAS